MVGYGNIAFAPSNKRFPVKNSGRLIVFLNGLALLKDRDFFVQDQSIYIVNANGYDIYQIFWDAPPPTGKVLSLKRKPIERANNGYKA